MARTGSFRAITAAVAAALTLGATSAPARACPMPVPPVRALVGGDGGAASQPVDIPDKDVALLQLRRFVETVAGEADSAFRQATPSLASFRAKCALEHLDHWASGKALLGRIEGDLAGAELRGALSGAAIAYLKVKALASSEQKSGVEGWLGALALAAQKTRSASPQDRTAHRYWLGLALGAAGLATGDERLWRTSETIMAEAEGRIGPDGALAIEIARPSRMAEAYAFALMPLVTHRELARLKCGSCATPDSGALQRLVELTVQGASDPAVFRRIAGVLQEPVAVPGAAWLPLYNEQHPGAFDPALLEMPSSHHWLGGNVLLIRRIGARPE